LKDTFDASKRFIVFCTRSFLVESLVDGKTPSK
jgi:hypothetical protein